MSNTDHEAAVHSLYIPYSACNSPLQKHPAKVMDSSETQIKQQSQTREVVSSPDYSLAGFSLGPATQTTVVTTTTTTTTQFPPLLLRNPRFSSQIDSEKYPLAASPTPPSIRNFAFEYQGQKAFFNEAEDPQATLAAMQRQHQKLIENDGTIRSTKRLKTDDGSLQDWRRQHVLSSTPNPYSQDRRLSPSPQLASAPAPIQTPVLSKRPLMRTNSGANSRPSRLHVVQTSTPITPSVADNDEDTLQNRCDSAQQVCLPTWRLKEPSEPQYRASTAMETSESVPEPLRTRLAGHSTTAVPGVSTETHHRRPVPLDTNEAQDISLPSPSLSPVTAAANMATRRGYFDHSETLVSRSPPNEMEEDAQADSLGSQETQEWQNSASLMPSSSSQGAKSVPSMLDIPAMLDSFDAMHENVKSYVMFQLLRRCERPVLHFVADNVVPALKVDFLDMLPPELGQHVLGFLDVKSLSRAAQVSKKWRHAIDSSEKTWKDLLYKEGHQLGLAELRRAITEGWGYQFGSWEKDIGRLPTREGDTISLAPTSVVEGGEEEFAIEMTLQDLQAHTSPPRRASKRKIPARARVASRKLQKRKDLRMDETVAFDTAALMKQVTTVDGPFAAAQVAIMALPNPSHAEVGLESLRNMHLYKSLYRRQYLIDCAWMNESAKPKHLAFKAHERHVVTCLHFDAERIITGSDDTNINVYDTKTGVLRNTLRGHDGGVWALKCYGDTLVSGSTDRSVRIWDIESNGVCTHIFHGHTSTVRCLVILTPTVVGRSSDGRVIVMPREPLIITGSRDSTLRIWRLPQTRDKEITAGSTPEQIEEHYFIRAMTGHTHSVRAIAAHGDTLISGSYDSTIRVWRISTGECVHTLRGHNQKVYSVVLDTDRKRCISGSMDNSVRVWSLTDGSCIHNLEGHTSLVGLLDLKGDKLVSAAADSTLRIWDPDNGHCKATLSAHTGAITCFQHDAHKVISGSDRTLKMWDTRTGEFVRDLLTDLSGVWQVGFDGRRCVAAVQRDQLTYIEVLDFGAARDGVPAHQLGRRIEVIQDGEEVNPSPDPATHNDVFMELGEVSSGMI